MSLDAYRIKPGTTVRLTRFNPDDSGPFKASDNGKARAKAKTESLVARLDALQSRLYAGGRRSLLVVLQGMDTSGKDGTIKSVMTGINPQGCSVVSFKAPSPTELAHDFLWRVHQRVPAKGMVGIFNRSHYEDVLITRVHGLISKKTVRHRFEQIRRFEELLQESGTAIVKFFLHISKDEQKERLQARVNDPEKRWKFNIGDVEERKRWDSYQRAFEDVIGETSTATAPWYIVPANRKWFRNYLVASVVVETLESMKLPRPMPAKDIDWDHLQID